MKDMTRWIESVFTDFWNVVGGIIGAIIAYLYPIHDILAFLIIVFIVDFIVGLWASKVLRKEKFSASKVWNGTITRMLFSILIIILLFVWGNIYSLNFAGLHNVAGGFLSGIIIISILQNMYKITKWKVILSIVETIKKKMKIKNDTIE